MKKNCLFLLAIFAILFNIACSDDKKEEVNCTDIGYPPITLIVVDKEDKPIALDSYKVMLNNEDVTLISDFSSPSFKYMQERGIYDILNGNNMKLGKTFLNKRAKAVVIGYIAEEEVFNTIVEVSASDCQVYSINTENKIVVDLNKE